MSLISQHTIFNYCGPVSVLFLAPAVFFVSINERNLFLVCVDQQDHGPYLKVLLTPAAHLGQSSSWEKRPLSMTFHLTSRSLYTDGYFCSDGQP